LRDLAARLGGRAIDVPAAAAPEPFAVAAPAEEPVPAQAEAPIVSRLAGHAKIGRIVARFAEQLPAKLAQMDAAAAAGEHGELAALGHWLKGAGGSVGFDQ